MSKLQKLFKKLRNKDYRAEFVSARVATAVGAQIAALRQKRGWNQQQLAEYADMKQPRIALLEKGDYESFSFRTLKRLASAFGVAVRIDFVNFADFLHWSESFNSESVLAPDSFEVTLATVEEAPTGFVVETPANTFLQTYGPITQPASGYWANMSGTIGTGIPYDSSGLSTEHTIRVSYNQPIAWEKRQEQEALPLKLAA